MTESTSRQTFINLPVKNLEQSKVFFSTLGFTFNPKFTDDKGACMILSEQAFVMLLAEPFFRTFTKREPCDTSKQTEALLALSCSSRAEVDSLVNSAISAGGTHAMDKQEHGSMYGWSFYDLDGHHWELMWMDQAAMEAGGAAAASD